MKEIDQTDLLYVTASQRGVTIANIAFRGASSLADVAMRVRDAAGDCRGMVNISLRNGSQGWGRRFSMVMC